MKKSQLREYIRNYINEIRLKSGDKGGSALKAFRDPDGIIYLIFKGISRFSVLHNYTVKIGREDPKTGQIKFELEGYDITNFKSALDILNIPYTSTTEGMYYKVGIDKEYIDIKNMSRYTLTDEDVKKDNWYTDITISEVRLKSGDKGSVFNISDIDFYDHNSIEHIFSVQATDKDIDNFENSWDVEPLWGSENGDFQIVELPTGEYLFAHADAEYYVKTPLGITIINK